MTRASFRLPGQPLKESLLSTVSLRRNPSPIVTQFVEEFRKAYQREPETLEAISYDGARFLTEILQTKSVSSPLQLREEIIPGRKFSGSFRFERLWRKRKGDTKPLILTVKDGQFVQVTP